MEELWFHNVAASFLEKLYNDKLCELSFNNGGNNLRYEPVFYLFI